MQETKKMSASEYKNLGNQAFSDGQYQKAINYYSQAITQDNSQSIYYSNRAKTYKMLKKYDDAYNDSLQAIELDDKNIKAHLISGQCLCEKGKNEDIKKIELAIIRMTKAKSLCAGQKKQDFEKELNKYILKAKKLIWLREKDEETKQNQQTVGQLKSLIEDDNILNEIEKSQLKQQIDKYVKLQPLKMEIPSFLRCQLTKELMMDPYTTPQGYSYEKEVLFGFFTKNGSIDPFTGQVITSIDNVYPNINLRQASDEFLKDNPWGFQFKADENYQNIEF